MFTTEDVGNRRNTDLKNEKITPKQFHAAEGVDDWRVLGGTLVTGEFAPNSWVLADAEGNEACLCTWLERES